MNNFTIDDNVVEGGIVHKLNNEYDVLGSVHSYSYRKNGKVEYNHVPIITVCDENGSIKSEPYAHDSHKPERAIENTISMVEYVVENPNEFIN